MQGLGHGGLSLLPAARASLGLGACTRRRSPVLIHSFLNSVSACLLHLRAPQDANPTAQTTLALKRLDKIVEEDQNLLLTRVQQRFRGWRVRNSLFGVLPAGSIKDAWSMRWAMQRKRAGRVVARFLRRVQGVKTWKRIGPVLQHLFAFARLEKEFGAKMRAIIAVALAPLQKNLGKAARGRAPRRLKPGFHPLLPAFSCVEFLGAEVATSGEREARQPPDVMPAMSHRQAFKQPLSNTIRRRRACRPIRPRPSPPALRRLPPFLSR